MNLVVHTELLLQVQQRMKSRRIAQVTEIRYKL
jgi:hypothetical protein